MIQPLNKMMIIQVWRWSLLSWMLIILLPNEPFPREAGALYQSGEVLQAGWCFNYQTIKSDRRYNWKSFQFCSHLCTQAPQSIENRNFKIGFYVGIKIWMRFQD